MAVSHQFRATSPIVQGPLELCDALNTSVLLSPIVMEGRLQPFYYYYYYYYYWNITMPVALSLACGCFCDTMTKSRGHHKHCMTSKTWNICSLDLLEKVHWPQFYRGQIRQRFFLRKYSFLPGLETRLTENTFFSRGLHRYHSIESLHWCQSVLSRVLLSASIGTEHFPFVLSHIPLSNTTK
jgi:hypothetical protein